MKNIKGFTLIEMLVVIAIIGLLSSVVLVALGPSRNKAKDARVVSDMNQVRAIAETLFSNGSYAATLAVGGTGDTGIQSLNTDVKANNGSVDMVIAGGGTAAYSAYAKLNSGSYYCVDSKGNAVTLAATGGITATGCQ